MRAEALEKCKLMAAMALFGTIGLFVRRIGLPSGLIVFVRSVVGMLFLLGVLLLRRKKPDFAAIWKHGLLLLLSGACLGVNWILLFEAYRYTTVATATLCYYLAPVLVMLAAPLLLKERLTLRRALCAVAALGGMVLVSGILSSGEFSPKGIVLGLGAAVFYAGLILLNRRLGALDAFDKTIAQLFVAALVVLPYTLLAESWSFSDFGGVTVILLLIVGILHTGIAYCLYFGAVGRLKAQTAAILSYLDPVVAVLLSALVLKEPLGMGGVLGSVFILGAALISELPEKRKE